MENSYLVGAHCGAHGFEKHCLAGRRESRKTNEHLWAVEVKVVLFIVSGRGSARGAYFRFAGKGLYDVSRVLGALNIIRTGIIFPEVREASFHIICGSSLKNFHSVSFLLLGVPHTDSENVHSRAEQYPSTPHYSVYTLSSFYLLISTAKNNLAFILKIHKGALFFKGFM